MRPKRLNPYPVMVTPEAAQSLPRWILLGLCALYLLSGFIGREPWREQELVHLAYMLSLSQGQSAWLRPEFLGIPLSQSGPLTHILGAAWIELFQGLLQPFTALRALFIGYMLLSFAAVWYALYQWAYHPIAKPIPFALGGEAPTKDYARSLADAGLLALLACFGLLQFAHETTPSTLDFLACCLALWAFAQNRSPSLTSTMLPSITLALAIVMLSLNGQAVIAMVVTLAAVAYHFLGSTRPPRTWLLFPIVAWLLLLSFYYIFRAQANLLLLTLPQWPNGATLKKELTLIAWFVWPAGYLAMWTLWRWRTIAFTSSHITVPLVFALTPIILSIGLSNGGRTLFMALPALSILAAYIMPTLKRHIGAFIDWFTMLFFSLGLLLFWVFWTSMHLGVPEKPAQNIAKLLIGFTPQFSLIALLIGCAATALWLALLVWRTSRLRKPLWKSMALPAGGVTLFWLISMTLFLPVWDFARSHQPLAKQIIANIGAQESRCALIDTVDIKPSKLAAIAYYTQLQLRPLGAQHLSSAQAKEKSGKTTNACPWLILSYSRAAHLETHEPAFMQQWRILNKARLPSKRNDASQDVLMFSLRRASKR